MSRVIAEQFWLTPEEVTLIDDLIAFGENNAFFETEGDEPEEAEENARTATILRKKLGIEAGPVEFS